MDKPLISRPCRGQTTQGLTAHRVRMASDSFKVPEALMLELEPAQQREIQSGAAGVGHAPSFVIPPVRMAIDTWHTLCPVMQDSTVVALVDGHKVLTVNDLSRPHQLGRIGLGVDDGTTGCVSDLNVKVLN